MKYDHIISAAQALNDQQFHLACGFYSTTSFLFEKANFAVVIDCNGTFTFYTTNDEKVKTIKAKPMSCGRGCYMDILITTTDTGAVFKLPEYSWTDHFPDCDGESDRWDADIIGIRDEVVYPA